MCEKMLWSLRSTHAASKVQLDAGETKSKCLQPQAWIMVVKRDSELIFEKWWFVKGILRNEANICILIWLQLDVLLKIQL